jgi:hypothetical protein
MSNETLQDDYKKFLPDFVDHRFDILKRAIIEGRGFEISHNLLVWMVERYRKLVGVPLEEPLNGQLIPQSPDEYHDLTEHDYLEALGIERLYAALVNAQESPEHLIHLAHALGRAAKETNILSDSKPNTPSLDPLPPTTLPLSINLPRTIVSSTSKLDDHPVAGDFHQYRHRVSTHDDIRATIDQSIRETSTGPMDEQSSNLSVSDMGNAARESTPDVDESPRHADEDQESISENVHGAGKMSHVQGPQATTDNLVVDGYMIGNNGESQDDSKNDESRMNVDSSNISANGMDTVLENCGESAKDNRNSRHGTDGEGKRKRTDSMALSPKKVLLLSLNRSNIDLTENSYQGHNERGNIKRSKPSSSTSGILAKANEPPIARSPMTTLADSTSPSRVRPIPHNSIHGEPPAIEVVEEGSYVANQQEASTSQQTLDTAISQLSAATQV